MNPRSLIPHFWKRILKGRQRGRWVSEKRHLEMCKLYKKYVITKKPTT